MKALWIIYDIVLDADILALLHAEKIAGYTRWPRLTGDGPQSGARLDDHIWPGANAAILTVQSDEIAACLMTRLQALRDEVGTLTGVWAFTTPVQDILH